MTNIKVFPLNPYQMNTHIIWDESGEGLMIDAGNINADDLQQIVDFIENENIKLKMLLNTHGHIDHRVGNNAIIEKFGIELYAHKAGLMFYESSNYDSFLGVKIDHAHMPDHYLEDGDKVKFGNTTLEVLYTPGHADGSICFYNAEQAFVVVGDVLFQQSIGRTDLPTGDYDLLIESIRTKLFTLPPDTEVYPGHGPTTRISYEKLDNPFVRGL